MNIKEAIDKRELSGYVMSSFQNVLGNEVSGVFNIEDFEFKNSPEEFRNFILSEMKRLDKKVCIFSSWILTKELYYKFKNYIQYEETQNNPELHIMFFPEVLTFIVFDSDETLKEFIKKSGNSIKEGSNLNIKEINESDNGIEIKFFNKVNLILFEEKPQEVLESINKDE